VRGIRPAVDCILCSVLAREKKVDNLLVFENELLAVTLNLYPYNPGHLMIFPKRHLEDVRNLNNDEWQALKPLQELALSVLDKIYKPTGYNLGFNIGRSGGASIAHIHFHIVPRYQNEIGFLEIFSDARIIVEKPKVSLKKIRAAFKELS